MTSIYQQCENRISNVKLYEGTDYKALLKDIEELVKRTNDIYLKCHTYPKIEVMLPVLTHLKKADAIIRNECVVENMYNQHVLREIAKEKSKTG